MITASRSKEGTLKLQQGHRKGRTTCEPERASGSRNNEDVSNTEIIGTGEPRNINQEEGDQSSSSTQSNSSSEDVSNTDSRLRRRWRTIGESGEDKVWRFYSEEEEQTRVDFRSETIGRDVVSGEETNALQSDDERREERDVSDQSEEQNINSRT